MNFRPRRKGADAHIDVVPFIDTLLYLIIFFSLSLNFVATQAIKLKLPQASLNEGVRERKEIRVFVTSGALRDGYHQGEFMVDGQIVTIDAVRQLVKSRSAGDPEAVVVIQADERVSQGEVVKVMDAARSAGVDKIAIATRPREQ